MRNEGRKNNFVYPKTPFPSFFDEEILGESPRRVSMGQSFFNGHFSPSETWNAKGRGG
jgi:hypothetical protein